MWKHVWLTVGFKDDEREPVKENLVSLKELIDQLQYYYDHEKDVDCIYVNAWKDV